MRKIIGLMMFICLINVASAIDIVQPVDFKIDNGVYLRVLSPQSALYFNVTENPHLLEVNLGTYQIFFTADSNKTLSNIRHDSLDDTCDFTISGNGILTFQTKMDRSFGTYYLFINNLEVFTNNADINGVMHLSSYFDGGTYNVSIRHTPTVVTTTSSRSSSNAASYPISWGEFPSTPTQIVPTILKTIDDAEGFIYQYGTALALGSVGIIILSVIYYYSLPKQQQNRFLRRKKIIKRINR